MPIKTKVIDVDENLRVARTIEVAVGSKTVVTPKRALSASKSKHYDEASLSNKVVRGFVEVYRRVDRERLRRAISDRSCELRFNRELTSLLKKAVGDITVGLIEYDVEDGKPEEREAEHLFHLLNSPLLDILVLPIVPKVPCDDYLKFLKGFVNAYESTSSRATLVPVIPHYSISDVVKLFEYYAKEDRVSKNLICVDFNGGNPVSQYTFVSNIAREVQRLEKEYGEPCVKYGVNLKYGKATKKQQVVPAKDIIIFAMGFNVFGANHKVVPISSGIGDYELGTKVFNRADYGYYSVGMAEKFVSEVGDFEVKLADVLRDARLAKVFNAERHGLEAFEISRAIDEGNLIKYIKSKPKIAEDQKTLKRVLEVNRATYEEGLSKYL